MTKVSRLLEQFAPDHYDVRFNINSEEMTFSGSVTITGELPEPSKSIELHAHDLAIEKVLIDGEPASAGRESKHHEIVISSVSELDAGTHKLELEFSGDITQSMVGIYPSDYEHADSKKHLIATQFEANHAREAFPCIDEPSAKATFQLTLESKIGEEALSNTPVESQEETDGKLVTVFEKTPRMSCYLLAFVTGEMHSVEAQTSDGLTIKCWSSLAQPTKNLEYALAEAVSLVEFYEDYFGVPYPLPKCDLVALPDFDAGAMENWGLITFREIALLADADNRSITSEQYVSLVVAHELAHMWFGNLVTMAWWDDLWLNESFASIMEHVALDAVHPDWNQWEHYAAMDIISTTSRDIHKDIQPISIELDDPELIETMFDPGIVYTKGARLMKMLIEYVGEDAFRAGLKQYFTDHAYKNATRADLWKALDHASGKDVAPLMSAWLDQAGMPQLSVTQSGNQLTIEQQRFIVDGSSDETLWPIPTLAQPTIDPEILREAQATQELDTADFVVFNHNASGHYITHYVNSDHRSAINDHFANKDLDASARINYLNDLLLLSRANVAELTEALDVVQQMESEDRYGVWGLASRVIAAAQQITEGDENAKEHLRLLRYTLACEQHKTLGVTDDPNDDPNTIQLRNFMFSMMLASEDEKALHQAEKMAHDAANPSKIPSEARAIVLSALIRNGDTKLATQLLDMYPGADAEMQLDIVSSLASTKDPRLASEMLEKAIGEDGFVRPQDLLRWLAIFMRNHYIRNAAWDYLVLNWTYLEKTLLKSKSFDYLPTYCAAVISTADMAQKYRDLFEPLLDNKLLTRNIRIGLADIDARVAWRQRNQQGVSKRLEDFARANQTTHSE